MTRRQLRLISLIFILSSIGLVAFNLYRGQRAYVHCQSLMEELEGLDREEGPLPREENHFPMPTVMVDGVEIIGHLEIPKLEKVLPITADWDYELMKNYPNRYRGENYDDPLIIMAHNYRKHFSDIHRLEKGDQIVFIDALGRRIDYRVDIKEVIDGYDVGSMTETDYDLTLFTCTLERTSRLAIRAVKL